MKFLHERYIEKKKKSPFAILSLMTTYSPGLRAIALKPENIDSKRMLIKVKKKGGKDRYTLLAKRLLSQLRCLFRGFRPAKPEEVGRPLRLKSTTYSGAKRPPI